MSHKTSVVSLLVIAISVCMTVQFFAQTSPRQYKLGERVEYVYDGKWLKALITEVATDKQVADNGPYHVYRVHPLGYETTMDTWVGDFRDNRSQLRPAGSGATEPVPGGEANDPVLSAMNASKTASPTPPLKAYHCVYFDGGQLVSVAPFTLTGATTYTDRDGKRGTYTFVVNTATLTFHGGNYDGQRAEYDTVGAKPALHILGPSGRRVIDCDIDTQIR
jgi:hypothetical protein